VTAVELESVHKFLTTLGVQRLTECIRIVPQTELYKPCPSLQAYVRQVVPWIQKQLYTEFTDVYNLLVSSGIKAQLAVMRFAEVCSRTVCLSLSGAEALCADQIKLIQWLGGVTVRTSNSGSKGREFDSWSGHYQVFTT